MIFRGVTKSAFVYLAVNWPIDGEEADGREE